MNVENSNTTVNITISNEIMGHTNVVLLIWNGEFSMRTAMAVTRNCWYNGINYTQNAHTYIKWTNTLCQYYYFCSWLDKWINRLILVSYSIHLFIFDSLLKIFTYENSCLITQIHENSWKKAVQIGSFWTLLAQNCMACENSSTLIIIRHLTNS